jgi:ubiquinone/menaquinone biosynthesis C-methylase UbiE/uncharacterized protein YbaR (Trm112 family)
LLDYIRTANATRVRAGLRYRLCRQLVRTIAADTLSDGEVGRAMNRFVPSLCTGGTGTDEYLSGVAAVTRRSGFGDKNHLRIGKSLPAAGVAGQEGSRLADPMAFTIDLVSFAMNLQPTLLDQLVCPVDQLPVLLADEELRCASGHNYPIVLGVPVLLIRHAQQTKEYFTYERIARRELPEAEWQPSPGDPIHPAVQVTVGATSGYMYSHLIRKLREYPIPEIRLPQVDSGERLLDVGCGWGRWTASAARKGYRVTAVDPDIGFVLTAQTVVKQLGLTADFVCADARFLPFKPGSFDHVFSYSVIQHFSKADARQSFTSIAGVLKPGGSALIQMASKFGIRSAYHQLRAKFHNVGPFAVRYWSPGDLRQAFERTIGPTQVSVDCYFGLGLQPSDTHLMTPARKMVLRTSELLRALSLRVPAMLYMSDSLYLHATKL